MVVDTASAGTIFAVESIEPLDFEPPGESTLHEVFGIDPTCYPSDVYFRENSRQKYKIRDFDRAIGLKRTQMRLSVSSLPDGGAQGANARPATMKRSRRSKRSKRSHAIRREMRTGILSGKLGFSLALATEIRCVLMRNFRQNFPNPTNWRDATPNIRFRMPMARGKFLLNRN